MNSSLKQVFWMLIISPTGEGMAIGKTDSPSQLLQTHYEAIMNLMPIIVLTEN